MLSDNKGSITVWMTLVLFCIYTLGLVLIWGLNNNYIVSFVDKITISSTKSIMSEYDKDIYKHYNLYVMDLGYGNKNRDGGTKEKIKDYLKASSDTVYESKIINSSDINGSNCTNINIKNIEITFQDSVANNSDLFKELVVDYMEEKLSDRDINTLKRKNCYKNAKKEDIMFIEYLIDNFSSYKNVDINNELNKMHIYEIEHLIIGKMDDNDCFENVMKSLGIKVENIDRYNLETYNNYMRNCLVKMNSDLLCKRAWNMVISNINKTYDKDIDINNCFCSVKVKCIYDPGIGFSKVKLIKNIVNKSSEIYYSEYKYSYI